MKTQRAGAYACPHCRGLGYLCCLDKAGAPTWPIACPECKGRILFSQRRLCGLLGVSHRTFKRLEGAATLRPVTGLRVLERLALHGLA